MNKEKSPQTIYTVYIRKIAHFGLTTRLFIYGKYRSSIYNRTLQTVNATGCYLHSMFCTDTDIIVTVNPLVWFAHEMCTVVPAQTV